MHAELIKIKKRWSERIKIRLPSVESTWTPATANNWVWFSVLERADLTANICTLSMSDCGQTRELRANRKISAMHDFNGKAINPFVSSFVCWDFINFHQTINLCDLSTGGAGKHATVYIRKVERKMLSDTTLQVSLPIKSETFMGK